MSEIPVVESNPQIREKDPTQCAEARGKEECYNGSGGPISQGTGVLAKVRLVGGLEGEEDDVPIRLPLPYLCLWLPFPPFLSFSLSLALKGFFPITDTLAHGTVPIRR